MQQPGRVERLWWPRLRWRMRGAWQWPAFALLTLVDAVLLTELPFYERGPGSLVAGALLAGFANLLLVAVVAPLAGMRVRRMRPDLPRPVAADYAGTLAMGVLTVALLGGGLLHRPAVAAEDADLAAVVASTSAYVSREEPASEQRAAQDGRAAHRGGPLPRLRPRIGGRPLAVRLRGHGAAPARRDARSGPGSGTAATASTAASARPAPNPLDGCAMESGRRSSQAWGIRTRVANMARLRVRGLAPSVGAGGSLVVAGLICLIGVSAMLAFRSWPGTDAGRPEGSLSLRTPAEKASGRAARGPLPAVTLVSATPAGAGTAAGGGAATRTRGDAPGRSDRGRGRGPVATTPQPPANATPPASGAQPVPVTTTPPAGQGGGGSGADGGSGSGSGGGGTGGGGGGGGSTPAGGPVQQVVGTGRQTVNNLTAPLPVPPAVQQPVDEVLDTTENVARTVDGVVGQVPVVGETVGDVTGVLLP